MKRNSYTSKCSQHFKMVNITINSFCSEISKNSKVETFLNFNFKKILCVFFSPYFLEKFKNKQKV